MTTAEVAKELRVSDRVVRLWITERLLPATREGRAWVVDRHDLEKALKTGAVERGA